MAGLAAGRPEALEDLYRRYAVRLSGYFWRAGCSAGEIDELVQDTFVRLWRGRGSWRGRGRLSTYLLGIARSVRLEAFGRRAGAAAGRELPEDLASSRSPHAELEGRELREKLAGAVAALPEPLREVFALAHGGELKYREIAGLLGIPVGTVKSRMAAAEEKLRASLSGYLGIDRP